MTPGPRTFLRNLRIVARQRRERAARVLGGPPDLLEIELVEQAQSRRTMPTESPSQVVLKFFFLLKNGRQRLAHEQDAVLRFLRPRHQIRRRRQVEELVRPHSTVNAPARSALVEKQRQRRSTRVSSRACA
jgi:hypothetical protein